MSTGSFIKKMEKNLRKKKKVRKMLKKNGLPCELRSGFYGPEIVALNFLSNRGSQRSEVLGLGHMTCPLITTSFHDTFGFHFLMHYIYQRDGKHYLKKKNYSDKEKFIMIFLLGF